MKKNDYPSNYTTKHKTFVVYDRIVNDPLELSCSFDGPCCWANAVDPQDEFDYRVSKQEPPSSVWDYYIGENAVKPG